MNIPIIFQEAEYVPPQTWGGIRPFNLRVVLPALFGAVYHQINQHSVLQFHINSDYCGLMSQWHIYYVLCIISVLYSPFSHLNQSQ